MLPSGLVRVMPKVERENPPTVLTHWAASREDFADYVRRTSELVKAQTGRDVELRITVRGYERAFTSTEEFLAHIDAPEWQEQRLVEFHLSSGDYPDVLRVWVGIAAPPVSKVRLHVAGATRRDRNAVEPDVLEAARRLQRSKARTRLRGAVVIGLLLAALGALEVGAAIGLKALGVSETVRFAATAVLSFALLGALLIRRLRDPVWRLAAGVEFLPDDRVCQWERTRTSVAAKVVAACAILGGVAAVLDLVLK